jgi:hypothetical protein
MQWQSSLHGAHACRAAAYNVLLEYQHRIPLAGAQLLLNQGPVVCMQRPVPLRRCAPVRFLETTMGGASGLQHLPSSVRLHVLEQTCSGLPTEGTSLLEGAAPD